MLTPERYTALMGRRLLQGRNWNSERENLALIFKASRAREVHPALVRVPRITSFSNG